MRANTSIPKYKLLTLLDLSKSSISTLKNAVRIAKMIDGSIEVFHVSKPSDVAKFENQVSVLRAMNEESVAVKSKIRKIIKEAQDEEQLSISYDFSFGNVKQEIKDHIEQSNPDIVVMGKRKFKYLNFFGDHLTGNLIKKFKGSVLIVDESTIIEPKNDLSIGLLSNHPLSKEASITEDLKKVTKSPIKYFSVNSGSNGVNTNKENTINFEAKKASNAILEISNYISQNNIELLCIVNEQENKKGITSSNSAKKTLNKAITEIKIPILITNQSSTQL